MKLKIIEPSNYLFTTNYQVSIGDINYGNHLGNDKYLSIAHEARIRFYKFLGIREKDIGDGVHTIMANSIINYKKEILHGETITIHVGVTNIGSASFDIVYQFVTDNQIATIISTAIVAMNNKTQKPTKLPDSFIEKVQ